MKSIQRSLCVIGLFFSLHCEEPRLPLTDYQLPIFTTPLQPFFFVYPALHYFGGNNLELLNERQPYDQYSFVQYIIDFGNNIHSKVTKDTNDRLDLNFTFRLKGNLGDISRYEFLFTPPIKIGYAEGGAQRTSGDHFSFWLREFLVSYQPEGCSQPFFSFGFFPYKLGNGLLLGNAYRLNQPIQGQYLYEQIDQFRPAFLVHLANNSETFFYKSIITCF